MTHFDCFNGDADGICALTQLRLAQPFDSVLITGVKRDIRLLDQVHAEHGDQVTVLDISLNKNREPLQKILDADARVFYCDHHAADPVPVHDNLTTLINTTADVCTSLLIDQHLRGKYRLWAVVGTFGDNLKKSAHGLARGQDIDEKQLGLLEQLGILMNYNGYGTELSDLYFEPAELYRRAVAYESPLQFIEDDRDTFDTLQDGYRSDMRQAESCSPIYEQDHAAVFLLPDETWARRVSGVFGNELANQNPDRAHAVVTSKQDELLVVSVRAPLNNKQGAVDVCSRFPSGGGRAAAAGINDLPNSRLEEFIGVFSEFYKN